jgi:hypothetical protein
MYLGIWNENQSINEILKNACPDMPTFFQKETNNHWFGPLDVLPTLQILTRILEKF